MDSSMGVGLMAVFAVSGSVVFIALQVHKRLLSDFIKKIELELGSEKYQTKKKVRFADDVMEPSSNNKEYRKKQLTKTAKSDQMEYLPYQSPDQELEDTMPLNRRVLYKKIIEYRTLKGHY